MIIKELEIIDNLKEELDIYKFQYEVLIRDLDIFTVGLSEKKKLQLRKLIAKNYNDISFYLNHFCRQQKYNAIYGKAVTESIKKEGK